jgi:chloramphenicol 3-O-phosphotransferase
LGFKVIKGIASLALFYYQQGLSVVIDDVIYYDEIMKNYCEVLKDTNAFIFKLFCQDENLLEREHYRSNRALGLGVAQMEIIDSKPWHYDKIIDTSNISADEIAKIIFDFLQEQHNNEKTTSAVNPQNPKALSYNLNIISI